MLDIEVLEGLLTRSSLEIDAEVADNSDGARWILTVNDFVKEIQGSIHVLPQRNTTR